MQDDLDDIKSGTQETVPIQDKEQKYPDASFGKKSSYLVINPFSEEGERISQPQEEGMGKQGNPFGVSVQRMSQPASNFSQRPVLGNGLTSMVPEGALIINEPKKSNKTLIIGIIVIFIAIFCVVGALWYFTAGDLGKLLKTDPVPEASESPLELPETPAPKPLPFSLDKPNYLSVDTEVVSSEDIRKTLAQAALRIKEADISKPVEFLVTDRNNNPLAFSRFAFLLKLGLDSDLLALIDEPFSLYAYNDTVGVRLGLVLTFKDAQAAAPVIAKTESGLPYALQTLIFESDAVVPESLVFQSSTSGRFPIRFTNIGSAGNVSFDYVLDGDRWYIGTSKDTLRAILDMATYPAGEEEQSVKNEAS